MSFGQCLHIFYNLDSSRRNWNNLSDYG
jgi:hypothetical protein